MYPAIAVSDHISSIVAIIGGARQSHCPYRSHNVISVFPTTQLAVFNEFYTVNVDFPLGKNYW
jgi:hypothetical protein